MTRNFGGLGLGLSIVRALVDMHGGSITAFSAGAGEGASFSFRVATVAPAAEAPMPAATGQTALPAVGATYRVLLVEDHDDTRDVLSRLLQSFGCEVAVAASVRQAVELADRQDFDLLLSDIGLPDGSGHDVMRLIGGRQKIKGIALSGFGHDDDLRRSREAGFAQHLVKPVDLRLLREAVLKVVGD